VVVMSTSTKAGERVTVRALTIGGVAVTITPDDVASVPEVVGHARVPVPFNPQSRHFQKQLTTNLNRELGPGGRRSGGRHRPPVSGDAASATAIAEVDVDSDVAGVGGCPDLKSHLAAAAQIDRLEADLRRNQKVQQIRSNSLVDQFERVLSLLDDVGCTDHWSLTDAGLTLAGVFHECDLLIADCVRAGLFDGLNPAQVAALASVFVFEARGPGRGNGDDLPRSFPKSIVDRWWRIADRAERLNDRESTYELPLTRRPDPGFAAIAHGWATGRALHTVMATEEITGGDLVRTMKALIDLLRQLGEVAPNPDTREVAREAARKLFRGVVSVSSTMGQTEPDSGDPEASVPDSADRHADEEHDPE
jgi:ATP-dependent RNA helicase HelY